MRFLVFAFVVIFSVNYSVFAQGLGDNKIRVIGEDGSVQEFEIPVIDALDIEKWVSPVKPESSVFSTKPVVNIEPELEIDVEVGSNSSAQQVVSFEDVYDPIPNLPIPARKPRMVEFISEVKGVQNVLNFDEVSAEEFITKKRATAIALEIAPPSRGLIVQKRVVGGRSAYAVIFRTEGGPYEILVDGQSGDVISVP